MQQTKLTVDVHKLVGFTDDQIRIMSTCVLPALTETLNSHAFMTKILNYEYRDYYRTWYGHKRYYDVENFKNNNGYTRQAIYDKIMTGADKFNPQADHDIDLALTLYFSNANVIGYTYPNTFATWTNKKYFNNWIKTDTGHQEIINNIVHEYMHNLGFDHDYRWNRTRKHTVPYAIGYIARDLSGRHTRIF